MAETIEQERLTGPDAGIGGNWNVIVLNDDHNTFDHVAHTLARYIPGITVADGFRIADSIHGSGRAIVWTGPLEPAEHYSDQLASAGLTVAPLERV